MADTNGGHLPATTLATSSDDPATLDLMLTCQSQIPGSLNQLDEAFILIYLKTRA